MLVPIQTSTSLQRLDPVTRERLHDRLHRTNHLIKTHGIKYFSDAGELLTGYDALRNRATFVCMGRSLLRTDLPTMADILADNGYHTDSFLADRRTGWYVTEGWPEESVRPSYE